MKRAVTKSRKQKKRPPAKKAMPKWEVIDGEVIFQPGDYTLADIKAALKALENAK